MGIEEILKIENNRTNDNLNKINQIKTKPL